MSTAIHSLRDVTELLVVNHNDWTSFSGVEFNVIHDIVGPMRGFFEFGKSYDKHIVPTPAVMLNQPETYPGEYFRFTKTAYIFAQQTCRKSNHRLAKQCKRYRRNHSPKPLYETACVPDYETACVPDAEDPSILYEYLERNEDVSLPYLTKPSSRREEIIVNRATFRNPRMKQVRDKVSDCIPELRRLGAHKIISVKKASPALIAFSQTARGKRILKIVYREGSKTRRVFVLRPEIRIRELNACIRDLQDSACSDKSNEARILKVNEEIEVKKNRKKRLKNLQHKESSIVGVKPV
jgi:hypothetical protein